MELKNLLNSQNWETSDLDYNTKTIEDELRKGINARVTELFRHYYRSLVLNSFFLLATIAVYFAKPSLDIILPLSLIGLCYIFLVGNVAWQLLFDQRPDHLADIQTTLRATIAYNQRMYRRQCRYFSLITTTSFAGGFLLGLILRGRSLEEIFTHPIVTSIIVISSVLIYFFSRTPSFRKLNQKLNPRYHRVKNDLEQQLKELEDINQN
jgi:hypothetical protein